MNLLLEGIKRSKYINFVPEYLRENENFLLYFYLLTRELDINFKNIKNFTDLINNDKVPIKFLESLGSYMNYRYVPNATEEFNRELSMRMNTIWEQRGTEHAIVMAGTHGWNPGWVGGDIFVPGYEISDNYAKLLKPRDYVFRHSISNFSGLHVFQDSFVYCDGVFILKVPYLNEDIRNRVYEVTQAGIRYIFEVSDSFFPNQDMDIIDLGQWNELSFYKRFRLLPLTDIELSNFYADTDIDFTYIIDMGIDREKRLDVLIHSYGRNGRQYHSGSFKTIFDNTLDLSLGASSLPLTFLKRKFKLSDETDIILPDTDISGDSNQETIIGGTTVNPDETTLDYTTAIFDEFSSKRSSNGLIGGNIKTVVDSSSISFSEESYFEDPFKVDGDDDKYIISSTGEYVDRKDKKGSDSIIRDVRGYFDDIEVDKEVRLTSIRSEFSSNRSGLGKQSGIITGSIDNMIEESVMTPDDVYYSIDDVIELRPDECRDTFYVSSVEYSKVDYFYYNQSI